MRLSKDAGKPRRRSPVLHLAPPLVFGLSIGVGQFGRKTSKERTGLCSLCFETCVMQNADPSSRCFIQSAHLFTAGAAGAGDPYRSIDTHPHTHTHTNASTHPTPRSPAPNRCCPPVLAFARAARTWSLRRAWDWNISSGPSRPDQRGEAGMRGMDSRNPMMDTIWHLSKEPSPKKHEKQQFEIFRFRYI